MAVNNPFLTGALPLQDNVIGYTSPRADRIGELVAERQGQGLGSLVPTVPTLRDAFEDRRKQYRGILGDSEEQKRQTQAQILFDLANTALAFSTAGSRPGMSPAERLAEAAVQTKLFPTIGARAQAAQEQKQKVDLAALQSAETAVAAKEKAAADLRKAILTKKPSKITTETRVTTQQVSIPGYGLVSANTPVELTDAEAREVQRKNPGSLKPFKDTPVSTEPRTTKEAVDIPGFGRVEAGVTIDLTDAEAQAVQRENPGSLVPYKAPGEAKSKPFFATTTIQFKNQTVLPGQEFRATDEELEDIPSSQYVSASQKASLTNLLLANGEVEIVKLIGNTLFAPDGSPVDLTTEKYKGALSISDERAFEVRNRAAKQAQAKEDLEGLLRGESIRSGIENIFGTPVANNRVLEVSEEHPLEFVTGEPIQTPVQAGVLAFDAVKAARDGIGFGPRLGEIASRVLGNLSVSFEDVFAEEVEARDFLNGLGVLFRVAFASSPRLNEAEQARLGSLFPDTSRFIDNPKDAIRKLVFLKRIARFELIENKQIIAESSDKSLVSQAERQSYSIESILKMLETVPETGFTSEAEFQDTLNTIINRRQNRGALQ
jgi:hypothetical protein